MLARAAKPKLSLAVPTLSLNTAAAAAPKSPFGSLAAAPASPSPLTPTARNTKLNKQAGTVAFASTLQVPSASAAAKSAGRSKKSVQFSADGPSVRLVSPMPRECYGEYSKMSREERRWTARQG